MKELSYLCSKFNVEKSDVTSIAILLFLTISTRLLLITRANYVYFVDPYFFLANSLDFVSSGDISDLGGSTFTLVLSGCSGYERAITFLFKVQL